MKQIELRGKYAVGEHRFTIVDDDLFEYLNQFKWKATQNGSKNNVYATRTQKGDDGVTRTIRMHRVVLGYSGVLDIDHINHNALDNRRVNLRIVSRSTNILNRRRHNYSGVCAQCKQPFVLVDHVVGGAPKYCSDSCAYAARSTSRPRRPIVPKQTISAICAWCKVAYAMTRPSHVYCSEPCRKAAKWKRQSGADTLPPSVKKLRFLREAEQHG